MKKIKFKIVVIVVAIFAILALYPKKVSSDYVSNLRDQQANLQSQLEASNAQVEIIQSDVSELVNEVAQLNEQITSQQLEVQLLQTQKKELQTKIEETENDLYKAGNTTYLDLLLQSSSLSEFISNYYMISKIVESDQLLLTQIEEEKKQLELSKLELKKQKKQLSETTEESENKAVALENMIVIKNNYISQLSAEEAKYANDIITMQTEIKKVEAEILTAATLNIGYDYVGGEMAWPVPGHTIITSNFGMRTHPITGVYKLHTGVDISASIGDTFIAANDGVVAKAEYNTAYGKMVLINHGGGVSTLYAHGSQIMVQVGQEVKRGDEVLKVGSTGYSTGPHAHFEVRINGQYVDPMPYITTKNN